MNAQLDHNISSSTPPQDVFDTITQGSQTANLDCMLCFPSFTIAKVLKPKGQNESLLICILLQTTSTTCLSPRANCRVLTFVSNKVTTIGIFHSSSEHQLLLPGTSGQEASRPKIKGISATAITCTVGKVIRIGINPATADTTADTHGRTTVPTHVHHRLQDVIGMAGMEDGVKPTLRLPSLHCAKIHRYNG